ncbi:hypothetical protein [Paenibacillus xylanexedens]|uniref:hypothetical protein n=1 Tax=Paenibacillus xylanexedens TaxID=528191 RepID=UPI00119CCD7D|nr:hypothetical protein [Paenibacillus xylanexedens]
MINNIDKFKESLIRKLLEKTDKYEIEWKWFDADEQEDLERKHYFYSTRPERRFPYDNEDILSDFPENYKIIADESMFVTIKYYKKKNKKYVKKKLRYGLIKGANSDEKMKGTMLSLICDKKSANYYIPIITSNSSEECRKELEELYYLAEFKMQNEMKLIEKWISGEFDEAAEEFEKQKAANKLEKAKKEANENLTTSKISERV